MSSLENGRARELAELASVELDPHKLIALVTELNFLLENEQKYSEATRRKVTRPLTSPLGPGDAP
jgi:hypothetical protein